MVRDGGATLLRGGAYKPRTSPYAFQGLGQEGLRLLAEAKAETGLPVVTELMDMRDIDAVLEVADVIQIGARNMQNYSLLAEVGRSGRPALLKRGLSATLDELLMAAEYILKEGNPTVMLCERGIRTFETAYRRFTLDLMAVPVLKELSHLPVIVDPSHAAGRRDLVLPLSLAAAAVGADGIIVEVHPNPDEAHLRRTAGAARRHVRRVRRGGGARRGAGGQGAQRRRDGGSPGAALGRSAPTPRARALKIAVLGVGLIGGRSAWPRAAGRCATCVAMTPTRVRAPPRSSSGRSTSRRRTSPPRSQARRSCSWRRRWGRWQRRCAGARAAGEDCVVSDVGSTKRAFAEARRRPALRRRPPSRRGADRGRRSTRARTCSTAPLGI